MASSKVAALVLAAGLPLAAWGQVNITPVVVQGDTVSGVGAVTVINNLAVNNSGQWIVEVDTDNSNTDADEALIKNGVLYLREGQALSLPTGGTLDGFDAVNINSAGNSGWNFFLAGTGGLSTDSGMFYNGTLVFQESTISTAAGFSANTPYIGFFESKINDSNQVFVVASIDDPAITSTVDRGLVRINYNPVGGTYTEVVLAKEGDVLPGMAAAVSDFGTTPQSFGFNNAGDAIYVVLSVGGTSDAVYRNLSAIAIEGGPSPVAARNWSSLSGASTAISNSGNYAHTGLLAGDTATDLIIIKNGAKFIQEGDAPPGVAGFTLTAFGTAQIVNIGDAGHVLWFGDWNDPDTTRDTGLFLDSAMLLQEGVTQVNGLTVQAIVSAQDGYAMSPNGRYVIVEVTLTDGVTPRAAALLIDTLTGGGCYPNCDGSTSTPLLTANDFQCFLNAYAAGLAYANCDESTSNPLLTANDFQCFLNAYAGGCS